MHPRNSFVCGLRKRGFLLAKISSLFFFFFLLTACKESQKAVTQNHQKIFTPFREFPLPSSIDFAGEKVPLEKEYIYEIWDREFTITVWDHRQIYLWLKRAGRYFPYIEKKIEEYNLPNDLKYIAVAESALLQNASSHVGARGIWQFIKPTARRWGLVVNRQVDERLNPHKATEKALKYLNYLYKKFGNWTLAAAAYNMGETRLTRFMKGQKMNSYYDLHLPAETQRYVFKILSIKSIFEHPTHFYHQIPAERIYQAMKGVNFQLYFDRVIEISDISQKLGVSYKFFKILNPHFTKNSIPKGEQTIVLFPKQKDRLVDFLESRIKKKGNDQKKNEQS